MKMKNKENITSRYRVECYRGNNITPENKRLIFLYTLIITTFTTSAAIFRSLPFTLSDDTDIQLNKRKTEKVEFHFTNICKTSWGGIIYLWIIFFGYRLGISENHMVY